MIQNALAWATERKEMPLCEQGRSNALQNQGEDEEFSFGNVKIKMAIRHLS